MGVYVGWVLMRDGCLCVVRECIVRVNVECEFM